MDGYKQNGGGYDKSVHADLVNEVLALALQCDQTRIASYMLEDEHSEFIYDFVPKRTFSAYTSTPSTGLCPEWYRGGQSCSLNDYASIVHWHVGKVAEYRQRLDGLKEDNGHPPTGDKREGVAQFGAVTTFAVAPKTHFEMPIEASRSAAQATARTILCIALQKLRGTRH